MLSFDQTPPAGWVSEAADYIILEEQGLSHWTGLPEPPAERPMEGGQRATMFRARTSRLLCLVGFAAVATLGAAVEHWLDLIP